MFTLGPPLWGGAAADPFDANVTLLMRFNGNLTDEKGHAFASDGSIGYTNPDWLGGSAVSINGTSGGNANVVYASSASSDFELTGDFCIEAAVRVASLNGVRTAICISLAGSVSYRITIEGSGANDIAAEIRNGAGTTVVMTGGSVSINTPYHIALTRFGSTFTLYLNGINVNGTATGYVPPAGACGLFIGAAARFGSAAMDGEIAWARLTKGNRRYTGNFTVPGEP